MCGNGVLIMTRRMSREQWTQFSPRCPTFPDSRRPLRRGGGDGMYQGERAEDGIGLYCSECRICRSRHRRSLQVLCYKGCGGRKDSMLMCCSMHVRAQRSNSVEKLGCLHVIKGAASPSRQDAFLLPFLYSPSWH